MDKGRLKLVVRFQTAFFMLEVVKSILNPDRHFAHDGFVIECLSASHGPESAIFNGVLIADIAVFIQIIQGLVKSDHAHAG